MTGQTELMPRQGAVAIEPHDPESIIRYALDRGAAVDVIERLMAVRRELKAEAAQSAFNGAMRAFQAECPVLPKSTPAIGRDNRPMYHYAAMPDIIKATKPLREKYGFSHKFTTAVEAGWVRCICTVTHMAGHAEESEFKVPATSRSPMMNEPQMYAAALTFVQRYTFCAAFGIVSADDTDARSERVKPAGPSKLQPDDAALKAMAAEVWRLLKSVRGVAHNWDAANDWLWRHELLDAAAGEAMPRVSLERMTTLRDALKNHPDL